MNENTLADLLRERMRGSREPAAQRLAGEVWQLVVDGTLDPGERLPTARQLAVALNVSPRSIERAYEELERRGVLAVRAGSGAFVNLSLPSEEDQARRRAFLEVCREAVERSAALGYDVEALLEALKDYRSVEIPRSTEQ